jgi:ABC-type nitrate/sulfonate/bicarbonate transport system substrate-binding protein
MAFTTYLCARAHGTRFTALPVFLVRGFHHGAVVCSTTAGITHPKDLEGRKVGVNRGYTVTTGVWARAVLQQEYGVDLDQVTWVLSGDEHVAAYEPPANVVPMPDGSTLEDMLVGGELAAIVGAQIDHPDVVPLVPDPTAAAFGALRSRGWYPINHLVVVRDDVLAEHPGVATALFEAFAEAKDRYVERLRTGAIEDPTPTDLMYQQVMEVTGQDPLPYGIEPNRAMVEELIDHAVRQHILDAAPPVDSLFAQGTEHLVATAG